MAMNERYDLVVWMVFAFLLLELMYLIVIPAFMTMHALHRRRPRRQGASTLPTTPLADAPDTRRLPPTGPGDGGRRDRLE
jgi:hypothetical protein